MDLKIVFKKRKKTSVVFFKKNIFKDLLFFLKKNNYSKIGLVIDSDLEKIFLKKILKKLKNLNVKVIVVPSGEKTKSLKFFEKILKTLVVEKFDKKSVLISFGGGVVGDLTGFCASVFMRGIDFVQVPTSLLAMVDSSVGGKTGIDFNNVKNILGCIHQPRAIFIQTSFLKTLPLKEFKSGLGEVVKYCVLDKKFFNWVNENFEKILKRNNETINELVFKSVELKARIVSKDEEDFFERKKLNLGHTLGHAFEANSGFKLSHGESIAIGVVYELKLANELGLINLREVEKIVSLIKKLGLKTSVLLEKKDFERILGFVKNDKKNSFEKIVFVFPEKIGSVKIFELGEEKVLNFLKRCLN